MVLLRTESQQGANILFKMDGGRDYPAFSKADATSGSLSYHAFSIISSKPSACGRSLFSIIT